MAKGQNFIFKYLGSSDDMWEEYITGLQIWDWICWSKSLNVNDLTCEFTVHIKYKKSQRYRYAGTWSFCCYLGTLEFNKRDLRKGRLDILDQKRSILHSSSRYKKCAEFRDYICRTACRDKLISISNKISRFVSQQSPRLIESPRTNGISTVTAACIICINTNVCIQTCTCMYEITRTGTWQRK